MRSHIVTLLLVAGLVVSLLLLMNSLADVRIPGNQMGYSPAQPIAFSHRLHAGELQVSCLYCHFGAEQSRHAGIPAASVCMNCHRFVTATLGAMRAEEETAKKENRKPGRVVSPEIQKIYDALALALDGTLQRDPKKNPVPLAWTKIHNVPDFVYFDHRPHVAVGVTCQQCHGAVETMDRVEQAQPLSMGWCVNCHRTATQTGIAGKAVNASIDCSSCHY